VDRLFLDANVLFTAAHKLDGKAAFLFAALEYGRWRLVSSLYALEEARRNLARKCPERSARLEALAAQVLVVPQPSASPPPLALPEQDVPIFAAARAASASHLLTGDSKHFGPYMNQAEKTEGVLIQTVTDYLRSL
jgi:hypothetical protein